MRGKAPVLHAPSSIHRSHQFGYAPERAHGPTEHGKGLMRHAY
jgi:hypothetical protein